MTPIAHHQLSVAARIGRGIAAGAVVAGLSLAVGLPSGIAQDTPADAPTLTERFPLDAVPTAPRAPAPPEGSEPAAPPSDEAAPTSDTSSDWVVFPLVIAGLVLLAGVAGVVALRRRRLRDSEPPIPPRHRSRAPDGRAGAAALDARVRPRRDDAGIDVNARIRPSEVPPVSQPDVTRTAPPAPPARAETSHPEPPAPAPDITLVEPAPGGPTPRPRVHDGAEDPPLPEIVLIGVSNGAGGRRDALPGLGDDPEPRAPPSLDELPDINLVEPSPPAAAPPPPPPPAPRALDPGSAALAARIRPDDAGLDAAARSLRRRTPPREESEGTEAFGPARERARTELEAAAHVATTTPPPPPPEPPPTPSLPSSVREIATPRHPPAAATVPVAVIHGVRSAFRALRSGPREAEERDRDR